MRRGRATRALRPPLLAVLLLALLTLLALSLALAALLAAATAVVALLGTAHGIGVARQRARGQRLRRQHLVPAVLHAEVDVKRLGQHVQDVRLQHMATGT